MMIITPVRAKCRVRRNENTAGNKITLYGIYILHVLAKSSKLPPTHAHAVFASYCTVATAAYTNGLYVF